MKATILDALEQQLRASSPDQRTPELSVPLVRNLFEAAQSGHAERVAALCRSWMDVVPEMATVTRFWLLNVQFFCSQTEALNVDQPTIVAKLVDVAVETQLPCAEAAARAARALWLATLGRHTLGLLDLGRAAVLLQDTTAGPDVESTLNGLYLRQLACNTLALALMRQGINDQALVWLQRCREVALSHPDGASGVFLASFNEAWVHLTTGFTLDMAEKPTEATVCYARSAHFFDYAATHNPQWAASSALAPSARLLSAAASVLEGKINASKRLETLLAHSIYTRPDHRAVCLLALAHGSRLAGNSQEAARILAAARSDLPTDHSFRSIMGRILWEEALISHVRPSDTAADDQMQRLVRFLIHDQQEERTARLSAYQDWIQLEQQRMQLLIEEGLSLIDDLTGLSNRRALASGLSNALAAADLHDDTAVLVFIDLDDFKLVNDEMSHHVGDIVLQLFAEEVRLIMRPGDVAVRYGGDEFVLLLVGRPVQAAQQQLQLLQRRFFACTKTDPRINRSVSFSAGAVVAYAGDTPERLLTQADHTMLNAKRSGRNTVLFHDRLAP